MNGLYLSLEGESPDVIVHDSVEYTVVEDSGAMLIDEQNVLDVFGDEIALESIKMESLYALESIVIGKTLTRTAAALLQLAAPVDIKVPALEHFSNPYTAKSVSSIATEGIMSNIWKAIKKIAFSIVKFFKRLFGIGGGGGSGKSKLNNIAKDFEETIKRTNDNLERIQRENMRKFQEAVNGGGSNEPYTGVSEVLHAKYEQDIDGKNYEALKAMANKVPKDIASKTISGPMDVLAFAITPNEKIDSSNMDRNLTVFKNAMTEITKHTSKLTPVQKSIEKLKDYVDTMNNDDIEVHKENITKLIEQCNKDLSVVVNELFYKDNDLFGDIVGFSPYYPGVMRYGAQLTKSDNPLSINKLSIKPCIDTVLSGVVPERCFITKPSGSVEERIKRLDKITTSFKSATDSAKGIWKSIDKNANMLIGVLEPIIDEKEPDPQDPLGILKRNTYKEVVSANRSIGALINDYISKIPTEYGYILGVYKKYL